MTTQYYCYSCDRSTDELDSVSDPESPDFDKACCPNCKSTAVTQKDDSYDNNDTYENEKYDYN